MKEQFLRSSVIFLLIQVIFKYLQMIGKPNGIVEHAEQVKQLKNVIETSDLWVKYKKMWILVLFRFFFVFLAISLSSMHVNDCNRCAVW